MVDTVLLAPFADLQARLIDYASRVDELRTPPVNAYAPPPVQGYPVAPVVPNVVVRPQPKCGVYRFWRDDRCIDARGY